MYTKLKELYVRSSYSMTNQFISWLSSPDQSQQNASIHNQANKFSTRYVCMHYQISCLKFQKPYINETHCSSGMAKYVRPNASVYIYINNNKNN